MNIHPFQAIYPNLTLIASPESFFGSVKEEYPEFKKAGFFRKSGQGAIYVYRISNKIRTFKGIIATTDIKDITSGKVLKHEHTLASKEQNMMKLILQRQAMIKPVLLAYDAVPAIDKFIDNIMVQTTPFFEVEFKEISEKHTIWELSDGNKIKAIQELFKTHIPQSYIADGHHRCSTTLKLRKSELKNLKSLLSVYLPFEELLIYDYNRVIDISQNMDYTVFMAKISKYVKIKLTRGPKRPKKKTQMALYAEGRWYMLEWRNKVLKSYRKEKFVLDATLVNRYILEKILKVEDVTTDQRIKYISGIEGLQGLKEMANKGLMRVGLCLYPVKKEELKYIADHNKTLPPKSTWFEPRIKNGMISQDLIIQH